MRATGSDTTRRAILTGAAAFTAATATGFPAGASPITAETEIQRLARERLRLKAIHDRIDADVDKVQAKMREMLPEKPRILVHNGLGRDELYTRKMWENAKRWTAWQSEARRAEEKAKGDAWWDESDRIRAIFRMDEIEAREEAAANAWLNVEAQLFDAEMTCAEDARIKLNIYKEIMDQPEGLEGPFLAIAERLIELGAH